MILRPNRAFLACLCACLAAGILAAVKPDRYGAVYYPGETAVFSVPSNAVSWRVTDCDGMDRGAGRVCGERLALTEDAVAHRFGAFRLEILQADGVTNIVWFARLTSREVAPCPWVGTGTHEHHGWWHGDLRFVDLIAAAGIGIVRDEPLWARTEREKDVYVPPQGFEAYVDRLRARGIRMNMLLNYGNPIYGDPLDAKAFARYCAWMAEHYRNRVDRFEIWNEPQNFQVRQRFTVPNDNGMVWIAKFIELTHAADDAIRAVRPDATVAVTGEDVEYFLDMMLTNGIARAHNAVSFHPYCHFQHRPEREYFLRDFGARQRAYARAHGGANRWCVTESGWSTFTGKGKFWEVAGCYPKASYAGQASCIVRMYLAARAAGCEFACQYDFMNDGCRPNEAEDNFGMVHADGTPKPSFAAVAFLTRLLGTAAFAGELSHVPDKCRVMRFVVDGKAILAAWSVEGDCIWDVPVSFGTPFRCRDLFGNDIPVPLVGEQRAVLTERPIYLDCICNGPRAPYAHDAERTPRLR